jgi:hypothetical protein
VAGCPCFVLFLFSGCATHLFSNLNSYLLFNNKKAKFLPYFFCPFLSVFFYLLRIRIRSVFGKQQGVRVLFYFSFLVVLHYAMGWAEAHGPAAQ